MMAFLSSPTDGLAPARGPGLRGTLRWALDRLRRYSGSVRPPPPRSLPLERLAYGAAQPLLGLRVLLGDFELLKEALVPAAWLAGACALVASFQGRELLTAEWLKAFYKTFAVLAPAPSVIFANHYARLAAQIRWRLGFGACGPREMPMTLLIKRLVQQALLVAFGLAPILGVAKILPQGDWIAGAIFGAWSLHWVVSDAFDDANVLRPGQTLKDVEREAEFKPRPWFVRMFRWMERHAPERPALLRKLLGRFAGLIDRLSKPWREEIALMEGSPRLSLGFALSTAALLSTPVLNLLFRPIAIAGATHVMGHIEQEEHSEKPDALGVRAEGLHDGLHQAPAGAPAAAGGDGRLPERSRGG